MYFLRQSSATSVELITSKSPFHIYKEASKFSFMHVSIQQNSLYELIKDRGYGLYTFRPSLFPFCAVPLLQVSGHLTEERNVKKNDRRNNWTRLSISITAQEIQF